MNIKKALVFSSLFSLCLLMVWLMSSCGQVSNGGGGGGVDISTISFYSAGADPTPVFDPSVGVTAAATWGAGNTMYDIYYTLREYVHSRDSGVVDRANLYRLLYDVETLFSSMTGEVVALSVPQIIVPPFDFSNNVTYEAAVNDETQERAAAMIFADATTRGIVSWIWRETDLPNKREVGVLEASFDHTSKALSVDFIFCVDYDTSTTLSDYNNRTRITGNSATHAFEFAQTIGGSSESSKLVQIVGKGISQGAGNYFLFKVKSNNNDGFNTPLYLVVSAEADEDTLETFDVSTEAYTDVASLPASVADYKSYVESTSFFAFADLLTDLANLNQGNSKAGTIYLDY